MNPTDFSETANHAVEQALELFLRYGAELHLLHVVEARHDEDATVASVLQDYLIEARGRRGAVSRAEGRCAAWISMSAAKRPVTGRERDGKDGVHL